MCCAVVGGLSVYLTPTQPHDTYTAHMAHTHGHSPWSVVQFFGPRCLAKLNEFSWPNIIITCSFASRNGVIVSFLKHTHTHTPAHTYTCTENDWVSVHYSDVRLRVTISVEFHVWVENAA